jgi:cobalt-precorrin 5A hydrolase
MSAPLVVSLTDAGEALAERLTRTEPGVEHVHRPAPFAEQVREAFRTGRPLILITATGIAVRTLAPVIGDKHSDPPVLVLDQGGQYVIPLLSGHEGGANDWGRRVARALGAELVLTTASAYTHPVRIAGIGCERDCPTEAMAAVLDEVLAAAGLDRGWLDGLASIDVKADEAGLIALAGELGLPLTTYSAERLQRHDGALTARSEHVQAAVGCYGVAEAAALAAVEDRAGRTGELVVGKHKGQRATAALACAYREVSDD